MTLADNRLAGRVGLVTGGLRGIGRGAVEALLSQGMTVCVSDIEPPDTATELLGALHDKVDYLVLDVAQEEAWQKAVGEIKDRHNRLDCLVNNAGTDCVGAVEELELSAWRRIMSINLDGVFLGIKTCTPLMRDTGATTPAGSTIINISSVMGKVGYIDTSAYNTSKGGVTLLTKAVAIEFAHKRTPIRVNSVHPGFVNTPLLDAGMQRMVENGAASKSSELTDAIALATPNGRIADPSEIGAAIGFLSSDDSSYMTGSELVVDGGWTAQ